MYAILDLETTGGNPSRDRVIEVAVLIHNGKRVIEQYNTLVNPGRNISPFIQAFTGITNEMVSSAPYFEAISDYIASLTSDRIFVAHDVRFDYAFIKNEFKRLGLTFNRRQLCTVRLARQLMPQKRSYNLKKLCNSLSIPLNNNHRAYADAAATGHLLEHLFKQGNSATIKNFINNEMGSVHLPPQLTYEDVDLLPEETGIYYLFNHKNQIIYVGQSKNIRQRVLSHFSGDLTSEKARAMKMATYSVSARITGSILLSTLLESQEIKRFMPDFNTAQRRKRYRYGLFLRKREDGLLTLMVGLINLQEVPLKSFTKRKLAEEYLMKLIGQHSLCYQIANTRMDPFGCKDGDFGDCIGSCPVKEIGTESYNEKIRRITASFDYPYRNFFILGKGREPGEFSFINIEEGHYKGFGFLNESESDGDPNHWKEHLIECYETAEIPNMILNYLKKNKKDKLVVY